MGMVTWILLCPRRSLTTFTFSSAKSNSVAAVWRISWKRMSGSWARFSSGLNTYRMKFDLRSHPPTVSPADRLKIFLFGGALLLLINFSMPMGGLIDIPTSFFLKNKLHLAANQLAVFKLVTGAPLFLSFMFGFLRDRWSEIQIRELRM